MDPYMEEIREAGTTLIYELTANLLVQDIYSIENKESSNVQR